MHRSRTLAWRLRRAVLGLPALGLLLLLYGRPAAQGAPQAAEGEEGKVFLPGASIGGENLPPNLRLSVHISYLVRLATDDPDTGLQLLKHDGLLLERADLVLLGELYGDFDAEQRERQARGASIEEQSYAREAFLGSILGQWISVLERKGHDVESYLRNVVAADRGSISSDGPLSIERLEQQAQTFGRGFEREYGKPLASILARREEVEQP